MAGSVRGAAARIKALYPLATYVHCSSHQLNLCVMKACFIQVCIATRVPLVASSFYEFRVYVVCALPTFMRAFNKQFVCYLSLWKL